VGKSEGVAKGVRIFDCEPNYGAFVKGKNVTVGDFPVRDIMDSDGEAEAEADGKAGEKIEEEEEEDEI
jgi:tubulin-folding cofactor B